MLGKGQRRANDFNKLVQASRVKATLKEDAFMWDNEGDNPEVVGKAYYGEIVTIQQDRGYKLYQIKKADGRVGWVTKRVLSIPPDRTTNRNKLSCEQVEGYVKWKAIDSDTDWLIWVDIDRQLTYVLKKKEELWELERMIVCSTGKNISPTKTGTYKIKDRGEWFYSDDFESGAMYWVRYCGSYLFHSLSMDKDRNIIDDTLGKRSSAGCIRMGLEDSKWFYDNIAKDSTVYVN